MSEKAPESLSTFVRLMRAALEEYEQATTPEDKQAAQDQMAMLIRSAYKRGGRGRAGSDE